LSPVPTTFEDFARSHLVEGEALLAACSPGGREVPGFFRRAELGGFVQAARARRGEVEPVPVLSAWASSGGPLSPACFDEPGRRAGEILLGMLRGELEPTSAWRSLPMILGGGKTIDFLAPMRAVFRRMRGLERRRHALSASTFMAHPWNDDPGLGWSTLVVTD